MAERALSAWGRAGRSGRLAQRMAVRVNGCSLAAAAVVLGSVVRCGRPAVGRRGCVRARRTYGPRRSLTRGRTSAGRNSCAAFDRLPRRATSANGARVNGARTMIARSRARNAQEARTVARLWVSLGRRRAALLELPGALARDLKNSCRSGRILVAVSFRRGISRVSRANHRSATLTGSNYLCTPITLP